MYSAYCSALAQAGSIDEPTTAQNRNVDTSFFVYLCLKRVPSEQASAHSTHSLNRLAHRSFLVRGSLFGLNFVSHSCHPSSSAHSRTTWYSHWFTHVQGSRRSEGKTSTRRGRVTVPVDNQNILTIVGGAASLSLSLFPSPPFDPSLYISFILYFLSQRVACPRLVPLGRAAKQLPYLLCVCFFVISRDSTIIYTVYII